MERTVAKAVVMQAGRQARPERGRKQSRTHRFSTVGGGGVCLGGSLQDSVVDVTNGVLVTPSDAALSASHPVTPSMKPWRMPAAALALSSLQVAALSTSRSTWKLALLSAARAAARVVFGGW
jgi:hypothetical protein